MNLYEIDSALKAAVAAAVDPETGEIDEAKYAELDQLQMDRDQKIENICLFIKNLRADAAALKAEKESFAARQKAAENRADSLTRYLDKYLSGQKWKAADNRAVVSYRKSETVNITDSVALPTEFLQFQAPKPDKVGIKRALKNGEDVPGAQLETHNRISIK